MAEYLSAGVYVEEVATAAQIVPGVTTSNMGIVGYAAQGPANVATLVQSFEQYTRVFGDLTPQSRMPLSLAAFFANGGRRAYVFRVPPADALAANAKRQSKISNVEVFTGTGLATTLGPIAIDTKLGAAALVPGSMDAVWRTAGTPVTGAVAKKSDGTTNLTLVPSQASYDGRIDPTALVTFDPRLDSVVRGTVTVKFTTVAASAVSIAVPVGTSSIVTAVDGDATDGAVVMFDHRSGRFSLRTYGTYTPTALGDTGNITLDFVPTLATSSAVDALGSITCVAAAALVDGETVVITTDDNGTVISKTFEFDQNGVSTGIPVPIAPTDSATQVRDSLLASINAQSDMRVKAVAVGTDKVALVPNSALAVGTVVLSETVVDTNFVVAPVVATSLGLWVGDVAASSGTINYSSGAGSIEAATAPHNKAPVLLTYTQNAWDLNPISVGTWGNNLRVRIAGSANYFTAATGTYSRFDMNVEQLNTQTGNYDVMEQYEELVFDDPTSPVYFADVVNELSDLITVSEPAGDMAPGQLNAIPYSMVLAGGSALAANKVISGTLAATPIAPRSVVITYTDPAGVVQTITDNGSGSLVGSVLASATNTINYTSGAVELTTLNLIKGGSLVTVSYASAAAETVHTEAFGDTSKNYAVGEDGSFDGVNWGRNQFTSAANLEASSSGLYAFNKVEEILQVVIPDFAGNTLISKDQLDYAAMRAASPSGGDRFIILCTPASYSAQQAVDWYRFDLGQNSDYAAIYWPWVRVADPLQNNRPVTFPPLAHIAGVYARTDATKNVGKSPGGTVDGALNYLTGLEQVTTLADRNVVYQNKINPLVAEAQTGLAVWGVRTISNQPDWKYINARRLFMYLEKSIYNATWWTVFENNGPALWAKVTSQIGSFLANLFSNGYFAGTNPSQAYFVVCDESNNTATTIEDGQVIIDIGVAPNKPAEFVRLRFQQKSLNS